MPPAVEPPSDPGTTHSGTGVSAGRSTATDVLEAVFRAESGRILATLIRILGDFDLAEEAMQDAMTAAATRWDNDGVPDNPGAWLTTTARRKAIDRFRRARARPESSIESGVEPAAPAPEAAMLDGLEPGIEDDRLRLVFTCCHPALNQDAQIALTLRTLGGLTTSEIARAFLVPTATLAQRLVRAKHKIRAARIPYQVPDRSQFAERLVPVLAVLYLIFNEGYAASGGQDLIRGELCADAIRLARTLTDLVPDEAEAHGLLALMLFQDSRRLARVASDGEPVRLEQQDRTLWDGDTIRAARQCLERARRLAAPGTYQLQATIASIHASSQDGQTDWAAIARLYDDLLRVQSTPVVALNRAAAVAMAAGPEAGLALLEDLHGAGLDDYLPYHATRADLLRRVGRNADAERAYRRALALAGNEAEATFFTRRLDELRNGC